MANFEIVDDYRVLPFKHPCTVILQGPSQCGKTQFAAKCIRFKMFEPMPSRIVWVYTEMQPIYRELKKELGELLTFKKELNQELYKSFNHENPALLILDDQMSECVKNELCAKLFTIGSHHKNLSVMFMMQNLTTKAGKHTKDITRRSEEHTSELQSH